jgi:hypothetical protein
MPRAILIDPNEAPQWIDLDADVRGHLAKLFPGGREAVELHRDDWTHLNDGLGIQVVVTECAMPGDAPNSFAARIVNALGGGWPVTGRVVFMALYDADVIDLTDEVFDWLVDIESGRIAVPFKMPKSKSDNDFQVWHFSNGDEEPSAEAYTTLPGAKRAALAGYEAGIAGPNYGVTYAWRPLDKSRSDHWCLDEDGRFTGWSVNRLRVAASAAEKAST